MTEHMCVTICTRERPQMLMACLRSVLPQLEAADVMTSMVVVENSRTATNQDAVLALRECFPSVRIEYRLEPQLGIPFARNMAVNAAIQLGADWIFFIDDDEEACAGWFSAYVTALRRWDNDVFRGPVKYIYPARQPSWLRLKSFDGGPTGTLVRRATTNNCVARAALFSSDGAGLRFDNRLRFCGGEDIELFARANKRGAYIRWVSEATVIEYQRSGRLSGRWLLERTRNVSASTLTIQKYHDGWRRACTSAGWKSLRILLQITIQLAMLPIFALKPDSGRKRIFKIRKKISRVHGMVLALSNRVPQPYQGHIN